MMMKNCIIGAGLSGIVLAKKLNDAVVLEKSRGIGGRIASRRLGSYTIDHGASQVSHSWLKDLSHDLTIHKEWEVALFSQVNHGYEIHSTVGKTIHAKNIIFSSPAPQTRAILKRSGIEAAFLDEVKYKSEIQFMLLAPIETDISSLYEWLTVKNLSVLEQKYALVLFAVHADFTDIFMENTKEDLKDFFLNAIDGKVLDSHVHKWRYSEVETSIDPKFQLALMEQNIFLMGDYFGNLGVDSSLQAADLIKGNLNED